MRASGRGALAPLGAPVVKVESDCLRPAFTAATYVVLGRRSTVTAFPDAAVASRKTWPSAFTEAGLERDLRS